MGGMLVAIGYGLATTLVVALVAVALFVLMRFVKWYFSPLHQLPGPSANKDFWFGTFPDLVNLPFMEAEKKWFEECGYNDTKVIHTTQLLGKSTVTVMDKDLAAKILAQYPVGRDGEEPSFPKHKPIFKLILGDGLLSLEGEGWKRHRRILEPFFNRNFLREAIGASVPSLLNRMIKCWEKAADFHCEIAIESHTSALFLDVIGDVALAYSFHGVDSIEEWAKNLKKGDDVQHKIEGELLHSLHNILEVNMMKLVWFCIQPPELIANVCHKINPKLGKGRKVLDKAADEVIANATQDKINNSNSSSVSSSSSKSLLHLMLKTQELPASDPKRLSHYEIHSELKTLIMGGHEAVAGWINWCLFVFCKHPDVQELVHQDIMKHVANETCEIDFDTIDQMVYYNAFLQEVLRLYPPTGQIVRVALKPESILGVHIPKDTSVQIPNFLIHRHPKYWPDAEKFLPERWISPTDEEKERRRSAYMPFGQGPRFCIGRQFVTMEVSLSLAYLVRAFRFHGAPSQRDTNFTFESLISMRAKPGFKVLLERRCYNNAKR
jgi:cytochrome P450